MVALGITELLVKILKMNSIIKMKFDKKQVFVGTIFFIIIAVLYFNSNVKKEIKTTDIKKNKLEAIGRVYDFVNNRSYNRYYYNYYYNGHYYNGNINAYGKGGEKLIGKFFLLEFSSKNPNFSNIHLDKEITDSARISDAGFKLK